MEITIPQKPKVVSKNNFEAVLEVEGLYPGYGVTLGNALRRVLLSSLKGAAVTLVKIKGISHEFSTLPGIMEDMVEVLLNIKKLRFIMHSDESMQASLKVQGEKKIVASDIKTPSQLEIVNTSAHIATLTDKKAALDMELTIERGFGYVPVESSKKDKLEIGSVALDAIFTPIRKINYEIENMRVGDRTDFERLRFFIETDGTIDPEQAFIEGASVLVNQFKQLGGIQEEVEAVVEDITEEEIEGKEEASEGVSDAIVLQTKISDLKASNRTQHALEVAGIKTLAGLVKKKESEILALDGIGEKGVVDLKKELKKLNVSLKE